MVVCGLACACENLANLIIAIGLGNLKNTVVPGHYDCRMNMGTRSLKCDDREHWIIYIGLKSAKLAVFHHVGTLISIIVREYRQKVANIRWKWHHCRSADFSKHVAESAKRWWVMSVCFSPIVSITMLEISIYTYNYELRSM